MKKNTLKTMLLASVLGLAVFSAVLPTYTPDSIPAPSEPAPTDEPPAETEPPAGDNDIRPLSDLEGQELE